MADLELPVKAVPLESDVKAVVSSVFPQLHDALRGEPGGVLLSKVFWDNSKQIYNTEVRSDDTWIVTFPKCGTTWAQEMIWLIANDCNFERARVSLLQRFPFLEAKVLLETVPGEIEEVGELSPEEIAKLPSPRFIKSHLPFHLLPSNLIDKAKVVYVARNPKDVITSYYYHHDLFHMKEGSFEQFADCFIRDEVMYGSFFNHVKEAWEKREHRNLHFMFYEDMKKDLRSEILKLAAFLNKSLTEEQIIAILDHLSFHSFKKNPAVNNESFKDIGMMKPDGHFIRKGETGDWKNNFSDQLNKRVNLWIRENLADSALPFSYE